MYLSASQRFPEELHLFRQVCLLLSSMSENYQGAHLHLKIVFQNKIIDRDSNQVLKLDFAFECHFHEVNSVPSNHTVPEALCT